jgi:hypothetical protein
VFESVTTFGDSGTLDQSSILMKNNILNFLLKGGKYKEKLKYQPIITTGPNNRVGIMPVGITTVGIMPWNPRYLPWQPFIISTESSIFCWRTLVLVG